MQQVEDEQEGPTQAEETGQGTPEDDYDEFSDDPEIIFRREYSKFDTVPLRQEQPLYWPAIGLLLTMICSFIGGAMVGILTSPTVTVTLVPVAKQVSLTAPLAVPVRHLAPVTLTQSASRKTTGRGHQDERRATGTLTIYNSLFTAQTVSTGTVFTSQDGVQVATSETVTIPANTPPFDGKAVVSAYALQPGARGNIPAGAIHLVSQGLLIENNPFTGGRDARNFQTVAQADVESLTLMLHTSLQQHIIGAFVVQSHETLMPTNCHLTTSADHGIGDEAITLTIQAHYTCSALAYDQSQVEQKSADAFTSTRPGKNYQLLGQLSSKVLSVTPFQVQVKGTWVYLLSEDEEQFLAQKIAGETPEQAKHYLLSTGCIVDARIPAQLPADPGHIHFETLIGE